MNTLSNYTKVYCSCLRKVTPRASQELNGIKNLKVGHRVKVVTCSCAIELMSASLNPRGCDPSGRRALIGAVLSLSQSRSLNFTYLPTMSKYMDGVNGSMKHFYLYKRCFVKILQKERNLCNINLYKEEANNIYTPALSLYGT